MILSILSVTSCCASCLTEGDYGLGKGRILFLAVDFSFQPGPRSDLIGRKRDVRIQMTNKAASG